VTLGILLTLKVARRFDTGDNRAAAYKDDADNTPSIITGIGDQEDK
jgi:hypothetical protein